MPVTVPNAIALANIADGSAIVASDHRNNYAAVQVGVNGLIAMFNAATAKGDLLVATAAGTFDRLAVGANGTALGADSAQPLGLKYAAAGATTYRKTTAKAVNTTVAATDLLNGEITVAPGAMGATGLMRLTAIGDYLQQSGGNTSSFRFQLLFGGTTIFDTGSPNLVLTSSALRYDWKLEAIIANTATGAQVCNFILTMSTNSGSATVAAQLTTGEGTYQGWPFATGNLARAQASGYNTSAVDTTAAKALVLNIINPSASASVETKLTSALIEIL